MYKIEMLEIEIQTYKTKNETLQRLLDKKEKPAKTVEKE
jgi:hypothetical protein